MKKNKKDSGISVTRTEVMTALRNKFPGMAHKIGHKTNEELAKVYKQMVLGCSDEVNVTVTHP